MNKKIIALILAALMMAPALLSCSESAVNTAEETQKTDISAAETTVETVEDDTELTDYERRQLIPDNLPDKNFNGEEFRVMSDPADVYMAEIISEELNGDACNDAVYNRNIGIEERFGVKIAVVENADPHAQVTTFATAGTDDAHIVGFEDYKANAPIVAGSLMNWIEAPYQDLSQPWHNKPANDGATINNILYAICSDLSTTSMTYTYATFANTDLLANYGYSAEDMYNLVKEGKWTIDKFIELTDTMYVDANGDGKRDVNDVYGYGYQITNPADVWLTAFGEKVCEFKDGEVVITFMSDKTVSILEKLVDWHYNHEGFYIHATQYDEEKYFLNQKLVFAPLRFATAYNTLREMEAVYTMLPVPKWDEEQEGYYTNADDKFTVFGLPLTSAANLDFVSIVFEALCAESYKQVYPAYYDQALKGKYSSDATTAEMVDLIMAGRAFDFSFQFGESCFNRLCYKIRDMLLAESSNISSQYRTIEKVVARSVPKTLGKAYGYGE